MLPFVIFYLLRSEIESTILYNEDSAEHETKSVRKKAVAIKCGQ